MRDPHVIGADIVVEKAQKGTVSSDLYAEGSNAGINVDALMEQAEALYELSEETFEEAINPE